MANSLLDSLLDDFIAMADSHREVGGIWREQPVDLLTFFTSSAFLNEAPYPGIQTEILKTIGKILWYKFTGDEKSCPEHLRRVTEAILMLGKGSGKDFLASGILAYICYLLCCMNDPHKYFKFGQDENIDIINIAQNSKQANDIFFKKLKARFNNCKWFKRVYKEPTKYNEYQILQNQIRFYKNITAHSTHSESESYEGFSPLVAIYDEIGGFKDSVAEACYSVLRSSAATRYNDKMFHILISYPRSRDSFFYRKFLEAKDDPEVWAIKGKSWEVNPNIDRKTLKKHYEQNPEEARMFYEVEPPEYVSSLFSFPEKIDSVVRVGKKSQCPNLIIQQKITTRSLGTGVQKHFIGLELFNLNLNPKYVYYLGGDGALKNDAYTISLFHAEPTLVTVVEEGQEVEKLINKPVEDLLLQWRPSKKDRLPVDLLNVSEILTHICRQVHVKKALFDTFNSAEVLQRLMELGVEAEDKTFSNPFQVKIYTNLKSLIYAGLIELLDDPGQYAHLDDYIPPNEELKRIKLINGNKIDHDPEYSKDFSDARAAAVWLCSTDEPESTSHFAIPTIVGVKLRR